MVEIPARIGHLQLIYGHYNPLTATTEPIKELGIERLDQEKHSEFFSKGSIFSNFDPTDLPVYTVSNPEEINMKDVLERWETNKMIHLKIVKCKEDTLP